MAKSDSIDFCGQWMVQKWYKVIVYGNSKGLNVTKSDCEQIIYFIDKHKAEICQTIKVINGMVCNLHEVYVLTQDGIHGYEIDVRQDAIQVADKKIITKIVQEGRNRRDQLAQLLSDLESCQ